MSDGEELAEVAPRAGAPLGAADADDGPGVGLLGDSDESTAAGGGGGSESILNESLLFFLLLLLDEPDLEEAEVGGRPSRWSS